VGGGETGGRRRRGGATRQRWAGPERAELSDVEEAEERQGRARRAAGLCVEEDRRRRREEENRGEQRGHVVPLTHDGSHVRVTPIENTMPLPLNMLI
jgi:hypothetical protein